MPFISKTPDPPYYAVVFTSINVDVDHKEHTALFRRMVERAEGYKGWFTCSGEELSRQEHDMAAVSLMNSRSVPGSMSRG